MNTVLVKVEDDIAVLSLNRPEALNAINMSLRQDLIQALADLVMRDNIKVLILKGEGRAFCAGADQKERKGKSYQEVREQRLLMPNIYNIIEDFPRPVIAAINGYALGGGLELALSCDIRVAAENALLGLPEVALGVLPAGGGTQRLTRVIGISKAKELIYTGSRISAKEAFILGLVNHVVPPEKLMEFTMEFARKIAANPSVAVAAAKRVINISENVDMKTGCLFELEASFTCLHEKMKT